MIDDLARLQIRVDSDGVSTADNRLGKLATQGAKTERATDGLTSSFKAMKGVLVSLGAIAAAKKLVDITREFEVLNAQLVTATGSAEGAEEAFAFVEQFAKDTPYDLAQVTESFTKLINYGLTPSREAMVAYGDTASAMGKDLDQMVEAVADATTGEFERLKTFGIKAKNQGDTIKFTFRGVSTEVGNSAGEIEQYLIDLGKNNFADNMATRMDTLDGKISNLGDTWDSLFRAVSENGTGGLIEESVELATEAIQTLTDLLASGALTGYIEAIGGQFDAVGEDIAATFDIVGPMFLDAFKEVSSNSEATADDVLAFFKNIPTHAIAAVRSTAVEIFAFYDKIVAYANEAKDKLNVFDGDTFDLDKQLKIIEQARTESQDDIWKKHEDAILKTGQAWEVATNRLEEYRKEQKKAQEAAQDPKAGAKFGIKPDEPASSGVDDAAEKAAEKAAAKLKAQQEKDYSELLDSLKSEEDAILESYQRRLQIIEDNAPDQEIKDRLTEKLNDQFATDALGDIDQIDTYQEQLDEINDYFERRRELILSNTALTEEQRTALETQLAQERNEQIAALEQERQSALLTASESLFDGLAGLAETFAGEQSGVYKAMFAASKAFAIADAIIKIQQGIASAAANPWPANLAAMASVVSATSSIVGTISGTNYSGAYDGGGNIPFGSFGIVGEVGPEIVEGPANVTSRKDTAELLKQAAQPAQAQPAQNNIRIVNAFDSAVVGDYLGSTSGEKVMMNVIKRNANTIKQLAG